MIRSIVFTIPDLTSPRARSISIPRKKPNTSNTQQMIRRFRASHSQNSDALKLKFIRRFSASLISERESLITNQSKYKPKPIRPKRNVVLQKSGKNLVVSSPRNLNLKHTANSTQTILNINTKYTRNEISFRPNTSAVTIGEVYKSPKSDTRITSPSAQTLQKKLIQFDRIKGIPQMLKEVFLRGKMKIDRLKREKYTYNFISKPYKH